MSSNSDAFHGQVPQKTDHRIRQSYAQLICGVYMGTGRLKAVQVHETKADTLHQLTVSLHGPRYLGAGACGGI